MSDVPNLAVITGAAVPLRIGKDQVLFRPLNIASLGDVTRRCVDSRLESLVTPDQVLPALKGHDTEVVLAALRQCSADRKRAVSPTTGEVLEWVFEDPVRIAQMLIDCIEGEYRPSAVELALAASADPTFMNRWREASGLAENPTMPPSAQSRARAAGKSRRST